MGSNGTKEGLQIPYFGEKRKLIAKNREGILLRPGLVEYLFRQFQNVLSPTNSE